MYCVTVLSENGYTNFNFVSGRLVYSTCIITKCTLVFFLSACSHCSFLSGLSFCRLIRPLLGLGLFVVCVLTVKDFPVAFLTVPFLGRPLSWLASGQQLHVHVCVSFAHIYMHQLIDSHT